MAVIEIDWKPSPKMLRTFGLIGLVAFGVFATLAYTRTWPLAGLSEGSGRTTSYVLSGLAAYCGVFAAIAPSALRPLYIILTVVSFPIGLVLSYIVMFIMYYLVITPIGLVFKLIGKDPLHRQFDAAAESYWIKRNPPADVSRYFRQF